MRTYEFQVYRSHRRHNGNRYQWTVIMDGAIGAAYCPWVALARCLARWEERGKPESAPADVEVSRGGPDWVLASIEDRGPGQRYRYHVTGRNLNVPQEDPDYRFTWSVPSIDDPRYDRTNVE